MALAPLLGKINCAGWVGTALAADVGEAATEPRGFALGMEYMVPGLAEVFAKTGVTWAKGAAIGCTWDDIEPAPPVNGRHSYRRDAVDRVVLEYQRAGFRHFHLYVRSQNRWASSRPIRSIGGGSSLPKPDHMDDYRAFLRAFVQRYDTHHPDHVPAC